VAKTATITLFVSVNLLSRVDNSVRQFSRVGRNCKKGTEIPVMVNVSAGGLREVTIPQ
jgi:hypothetical protein